MLRSCGSWIILAAAAWALLAMATPAVGQVRIIDVEYPVPLPFYGGEDLQDFGPDAADFAMMMPKYFQRPFDDLTPRPGAHAMGMGGAMVSRPTGAYSMAWNPAGLGLLRERAIAFDGFVRTSSGTMERDDLPDTIFVEGQPEFRIAEYTDRLGTMNAFGFAGIALPLVQVQGRPIVGGLAYRRHINVAYGTESIFEMTLVEGTGFPFILGSDNRERGAIYSYTASLGYQPIATSNLELALGATANVLDGRLRSNEVDRVNVRGYLEGKIDYQANYSGASFEAGGLLRVADLVQLGAWIGLPYDLKVGDGRFTTLSLVTPEATEVLRLHGTLADYRLEVPMFFSGGASVGPIKGITVSADVNYRPWSELEIKYNPDFTIPIGGGVDLPYSIFDGPYPAEDVTSVHAGVEFEFPLLRQALRGRGMQLLTHAGYRTVPLSMQEVDLVNGEAPYYLGDQVEGSAVSLGFSLDTGIGVLFHTGMEFQSYSYRKWVLDDSRENDVRELSFSDPYSRAATLDRSVTLFRFSTEMKL